MLKKIIAITFISSSATQGSESLIKQWTELKLEIENNTLKAQQTIRQTVMICTGAFYNTFETRDYPQNTTYPIKDEYAVVKPSGFHDYSNRENPLTCLILDRHATAYIDSSKKSIIVYAASGSKIYDAGGNAQVTDIDFAGSYYESDCLYLKDRTQYYCKKFILTAGVLGLSAVVGLLTAVIMRTCRNTH